MARIISIANQKGGVAKTTSCLALGACLAEAGWRTLALDLDPQAHLTLAAGLKAEQLPWSLADVMDSQNSTPALSEIIQPTAAPGLDLFPGDIRLAKTERIFYNQAGYEMTLSRLLSPLAADYDFILLDCPPSLGALTIVALSASHLALIPVQADYFASQGVLNLLEIIRGVQGHVNPNLDYALFVTMYDGRTLVSRQVLEQLRSHFDGRLFTTIIRTDTRLRESAIVGEPVTVYAPRTRASQQYRSLTGEVARRVAEKETP